MSTNMVLMRKLSFKRHITYLTLFSINMCGVFPFKSQSNIIVRYIVICFAIFGTLYMCGLSVLEAYLQNYDFLTNMSIILNVSTMLVCVCNPAISIIKKKYLRKLLLLIDTGFYTYSDENTFQLKEYSADELFVKEVAICIFVLVTYSTMTLASLPVTLMSKEENSAFDLVYVAWCPFGIYTKKRFFFSYIMQFISTNPMYPAFIGKVLLIFNVNREMRYQCEKLRYAMRTICNRTSGGKVLKDDESRNENQRIDWIFFKCDETEFIMKLVECELHYRQLQKCLDYFSRWFNLLFSCELTYGFVSFALIGYVLIQGTGNRATDLKYVFLLLLFGGQFCYQCVAGEMFHTFEEEVINELYNIPWYNQTPKVRQHVHIFLSEMRKSTKLRGFKIYPSSIQIFTAIVRTSYSYLNLLNKVMNK